MIRLITLTEEQMSQGNLRLQFCKSESHLPIFGNVDHIEESKYILMLQVLHDDDLSEHSLGINLRQTK